MELVIVLLRALGYKFSMDIQSADLQRPRRDASRRVSTSKYRVFHWMIYTPNSIN